MFAVPLGLHQFRLCNLSARDRGSRSVVRPVSIDVVKDYEIPLFYSLTAGVAPFASAAHFPDQSFGCVFVEPGTNRFGDRCCRDNRRGMARAVFAASAPSGRRRYFR